MSDGNAVPVKIDRAIYDKMKDLAIHRRTSATDVINEALKLWLETEGDPTLETYDEGQALDFAMAN